MLHIGSPGLTDPACLRLCTCEPQLPTSPPPATAMLLFASKSFTILNFTYEWDHVVFVFLCLLISLRTIPFLAPPCCCQWQHFLLFKGVVIPLCICTTSSLSIFTHSWTCCIEHGGVAISSRYWFHVHWIYIWKVGLLSHMVVLFWIFWGISTFYNSQHM